VLKRCSRVLRSTQRYSPHSVVPHLTCGRMPVGARPFVERHRALARARNKRVRTHARTPNPRKRCVGAGTRTHPHVRRVGSPLDRHVSVRVRAARVPRSAQGVLKGYHLSTT
jgi:hypothetical protein